MPPSRSRSCRHSLNLNMPKKHVHIKTGTANKWTPSTIWGAYTSTLSTSISLFKHLVWDIKLRTK